MQNVNCKHMNSAKRINTLALEDKNKWKIKWPERISLIKSYKDKQNRHITLTKVLMKIAALK